MRPHGALAWALPTPPCPASAPRAPTRAPRACCAAACTERPRAAGALPGKRPCRAPAWAPPPAQACLLRRRGAAQPRERCPAICAEFRRQPGASPSGRGGPGTDYADDVHRRRSQYDYAPPPGGQRGVGDGLRDAPPRGPPPGGGGDGGGSGGGMSNFTKAVIAGAFIMGMGTGVWFTSEASFHPSNVASTEIIDRQTPNSEVCMANGYSSMVFDQRIFVSFNPFNVYVAQPEVKPGCVFRRSNISLLEKKRLVTDKEVGACTRNMNTFAFVGDLERSPEVSCVYHSEDAENQFLQNPKRAAMGDGFQPREDAGDAARAAAGDAR